MKKLFLLMFLVVTLAACAPDPRDAADAYATITQADQVAADATQARIERQRLADYDAQRKEAAAAEVDAGIKTFVRYATFTAVLVMIAFAVSLAITLRDIGRGAGLAAVTAMELKARLIPLDPVTRQYPLLLQSIGKGQFSLTNPNANSVLILDTRKDADRLMILSMARTQAIGSLARESRLSLKPGEVSRIDLSALEVIE